VVVLAITSSALWIASRLEIPALHLHPPAVSAALHMSGRDARTPAGHIHESEIPSQRRATPIPPLLPIHTRFTYAYIHTWFHSCLLRHPFPRHRSPHRAEARLYGIGMDGEPSINNHDEHIHTYIHKEPYIPLHRVAAPDEVRADRDVDEDPSAASQHPSLASDPFPSLASSLSFIACFQMGYAYNA
jgi:hypothetical protein